MKNSIITSVESKLQEMKTSFHNMALKTYSDAVQQRQASIDPNSVDEGYLIIPETVHPAILHRLC